MNVLLPLLIIIRLIREIFNTFHVTFFADGKYDNAYPVHRYIKQMYKSNINKEVD